MIVVEYNDEQYGDVMRDVECIGDMASKIASKIKTLGHLIGENSMSMKSKYYPKDDLIYPRYKARMKSDYEDDWYEKDYNRRYM